MTTCRTTGFHFLVIAGIVVLMAAAAVSAHAAGPENSGPSDQQAPGIQADTKFPVPDSLTEEHAALHAELEQIIQAGGKTGEAARAVAAALQPHFVKEENYALPPLGLLPELAQGKVTPEMAAILPLTDELQRSLPQMLAEHQQILAALNRLSAAAKAEHRPDAARFAQDLIHHAQTEEQITYPAAILVGEYVRLKLGATHTSAGN